MAETNKESQSELEERAKKFILDRMTAYSDRSGLEDIWEKCDKLYNNISTESFYEGAANLFPPETRRACKTLINFADEVLFNADPPFQIKGVGGPEDTKKSEVLVTTLNWQQQKVKIRMKIRRLLETLVKFGVVIVKAPWLVKEKYVLDNSNDRTKLKDKISGKNSDDISKKLKTIYDNIDFQVKSIFAIYWNYFEEWENQDCIIERSSVTWNHLKMLEKAGIYHDIDRGKIEEGKKVKSNFDDEKIANKWTHIQDITGLSAGSKPKSNIYELLEAWCNFDIDNDGIDEECVMVLLNREHIIRLDLNPYDIQEKPYLWVCWDNIEGTSLGMGIPQLVENSQIALNDFTNQIMDNITQILNCMKIVDDLAEIPSAQLKSRPNGVINSKTGVEAVKFLRPPSTSGDGLQAVAMAKEDIRQASGATVSLQGMPARYDTTATEYQAQGQASARDVFAKLREIEDRIIKEFLRRAYSYDMQFMTREDFIKIVGETAAQSFVGTNESPRELKKSLQADIDFIPLGVTQLENKVIKGQQLINFLNITGKLPPGIIDIPKLAKKIWKVIGDGDDIVIPQPTETLVSAEDENILMKQGESVHAKIMENHQYHLNVHMRLALPPEMEQLKQQHIMEHQQVIAMLMQSQGNGVQPQNQPRIAPETITSAIAGKIPNKPVGAI